MNNKIQGELMNEVWGLQRFYYNSSGFHDQCAKNCLPVSGGKHFPYLEAIIGAKYLSDGLDSCREWVMERVYPELESMAIKKGQK